MLILLCIRIVYILELNQLHIRNQYEQEVQHWPFISLKVTSGQITEKGYATNAFL
jgi:hypothetical protein